VIETPFFFPFREQTTYGADFTISGDGQDNSQYTSIAVNTATVEIKSNFFYPSTGSMWNEAESYANNVCGVTATVIIFWDDGRHGFRVLFFGFKY